MPRVVLGMLFASLCSPASGTEPIFVDVAERVGLDFRHEDGRSGRYYFVETVASGGGWVDFDADGDLDVYAINGAVAEGVPTSGPTNRLFEQRDGRFVDVTSASGLGDRGYGMGFCVGDADGDGLDDVYVTNVGPDRLYRHLGGGRYEDVSTRAGVAASEAWSVSCAFGDLDSDGDLDLYVTRYVEGGLDGTVECKDQSRGLQSYCHPSRYEAARDVLLMNQGDGRYEDQGSRRGIAQGRRDRGLGLAVVDLDADGDLDIFVANDSAPNRMFLNDGAGRFEDQGLIAGTALNASGATEAGMGVAVGDVRDGLVDLVVGNFSLETNTYYRNLGAGLFDDVTEEVGLAKPSFEPLTWGLELFDADLDGDLDLAVANGHIMENIDRFVPGLLYEQPNQLLLAEGGRFVDASGRLGQAWSARGVSRALAIGDWNDDGCLDVLVTNTNGPLQLLENRCPEARSWLGLVVTDRRGATAIGAVARFVRGDQIQTRRVRSGGSVMSQNDLRLHVGLGESAEPVEVEVTWPSGRVARRTVNELNRYLPIAEPPR